MRLRQQERRRGTWSHPVTRRPRPPTCAERVSAARPNADTGNGSNAPNAASMQRRQELLQLRRDVAMLRMEREILKKAAAFFAKESR